ncbi:hypothetical protein BJX61DRAFT_544638 [Aspergillus egyptiacus]|nr:hypothetical protein BJX61DRAFT_544638 [Aspergillus egyptiacus]
MHAGPESLAAPSDIARMQRRRTPSTLNLQSVSKLDARSVWFLTATPMSKRALDLCGYLALLWKDSMAKVHEADKRNKINTENTLAETPLNLAEEYREFSGPDSLDGLENLPYHLLSPW